MENKRAIFEIDVGEITGDGWEPGTYTWRIRLSPELDDIPSGATIYNVVPPVLSFTRGSWRHNTSGAQGTLSIGGYANAVFPSGATDDDIEFFDLDVTAVFPSVLRVTKEWQDVQVVFAVSAGSGHFYLTEDCEVSLYVSYEYDPTAHHALYWYNGSAWQECDVYTYDGTQWQQCEVYQYDGTKWQSCAT